MAKDLAIAGAAAQSGISAGMSPEEFWSRLRHAQPHARNNGVGMQKDGLLPITQKALLLYHFLRYHDFEEAAFTLGERERGTSYRT